MLLTTELLQQRNASGLNCLAASVYQRYQKELYALQYSVNAQIPEKLMLLLYALGSWVNLPGSSNTLTESQLLAIVDNIVKLQTCICKEDVDTSETLTGNYLATEDYIAITTEDGSLILI